VTDPSTAPPWWLIAVVFPVAFAALWAAVCFLISVLSGWSRLARHYATDAPPSGTFFRMQTAHLGWSSYRNCLNLAAVPDGLFLWPLWPFRVGHARLFVPWGDLTAAPDRILFLPCIALAFARVPRLRLRVRTKLGARLVAESGGALGLVDRLPQ